MTRHLRTLLFLLLALTLAAAPALAEEPLEIEPEVTVNPAVLKKLMTEGDKLAADGQHLSAALRYHDIVENGAPEEAIVKDAQFKLGVSLYELKLYQSALLRFEPIVEAGKEHPHYIEVLRYLLKVADAAGAEADVLFKLAQYPPDMYPPELANEIHFLVGQHFFNEDSLDDALVRFQQVNEKAGETYAKARYLEAVIHTVQSKLNTDPENADAGALKEAANNFKQVLRYHRDHPEASDAIDKLAEMTYLALGRLFFSTRQYNVAVRYYDQIEIRTPNWLNALFEVSWVYYQLNNFPRALGNLHSLNSPYFDDQYFPESKVLQALILFYNCKYEEALAIVKEFVAEYYPLMKQLQEQVNQFTDPNAFYTWLAQLAREKGTQEFSERYKRIFNAALADRKLRRKFGFVTVLNKEIQRLDALLKVQPAAKPVVEGLKGEIAAYRALVIGEAGSLAQARLQRVLKELRQHLAGALKIKGETLKAQRNALSDAVKREQAEAAARPQTVVVDDEHFEWAFTGEYWKDELGFYVYDIKSQCKVAKKKPVRPPAQ